MTLPRRRLLAGLGGLAAAGLPALARGRTYSDTVNTIGQTLDEIRAAGSVRIAFYRDYRPFSWEAEAGWTGIDLEVAGLIAEGLGVGLGPMPIQAGETVDDDLRNAVWRGFTVDKSWANLLLHVPVDRQLEIRSELAVIMAPYFVDQIAIALDPEQVEGEFSLGMFEGKRVAVELDTLGDIYLTMHQGGRLREALVRARTAEEAAEALRTGEAAALMAPRAQIEGLLGADMSRFELILGPFPQLPMASWPIGCAVRENARDLGYAVGDIVTAAIRDGRMEAIFNRFGVTYRAPTLME